MEKNDVLRMNEIILRLHTSQSLTELQRVMLTSLNLLIPCSYASLVPIHMDPDTQKVTYGTPQCVPESFQKAEEEWIRQRSYSHTLWVSQAPEAVVVRQTDLMKDCSWRQTPIYNKVYRSYDIYDILLLNMVYQNENMALLALFRTTADGAFSEQDAFYCNLLSPHINYAYHIRLHQSAQAERVKRTLAQIAEEYNLTRREQEITELVMQGLTTEELLKKFQISQYTLAKHLQNIYRKCGVTSRLELMKLGN